MQKTNNYNLNKPEGDDLYDVNDMNDNMDVIDAELKEINTKVANAVTASNEHTENTSNPHSVTKSQIGLENVENKSSATIRGELTSGNVTSALGYTPIDSSAKGSANGLAELDENGKVLASQLPSYVDDVIEGYLNNGKFYKESSYTTVINGESGKIYVDLSNNKTYRWSGSSFAIVSDTLALGETSSTAYRGDRGKTAYEHSQKTSGNPHGVTASEVGAVATGGDTATNTVAFTSSDVADGSATAWTSVTKLTSGITHATFFARVSQMFKNVRYLYKMLGTTDVSAIGDGTITGGLSTLNSNLETKNTIRRHSNANGYISFDTVAIDDTMCLKVVIDGTNAIAIKGDSWVDV